MTTLSSLFDQAQIIFVVGPTASGKSDYALSLAEKYNGIIINSDAMQIYSELSIITARPSLQEMRDIPHLLYGFKKLNEPYNVMDWCLDVQKIINEHQDRKIIIVGGTALYTDSLINGISNIPDINDNIRAEARSIGNQELYEYLEKNDPTAHQKLHLNDTQRLARAYEVYRQTGKSIYEFQNSKMQFLPDTLKTHGIFLNPPRDILYDRINKRFDRMIEQGAIEEVQQVRHYDRTLQGMKSVGIPEILDYLEGKKTFDEAIDKAKQSSRNYAKRQVTFFKNRFDGFESLSVF